MKTGTRALIGYTCAYTPLPLIRAAGFEPYRVLPLSDAPDAAGERLHDNLCPHVKRVLDRALAGDLPALAGMVLVNSCDAMRRLADAWPTSGPDRRVALMDLPVQAGSHAEAFLAAELEQLAHELEKWSGGPLTGSAIVAAAADCDRLASELGRLADTWLTRLDGPEAWQAEALAAVTQPLEHSLARIEGLLAAPQTEPRAARSNPAVLLFGNVLPDPQALALFGQAGLRVVADDLCTGARQLLPYRLDDPKRVFEQLAHALLTRPACARTFVPERPGALAEQVLARAREAGAQAVVAHVLKFCDPYLSRLPAVREKLKEAGLPLLVLEGDCSLRSLGQQRTRIEAFAEMIGA